MPYTDKISCQPSVADSPQDYRLSHIRKGEEYDAELRQTPFDAYISAVEEQILTALVKRLFPRGVNRYLDFACGTGRITRLIEPLASESLGIDVSAPMLETARLRCRRTGFLLRDITREKVDLPPLDLITAFRFFGNAQDELRRSALASIRPLLADGGYLVLNNHRNPFTVRNLLVKMTGGTLAEYRGRTIDLNYWKLTSMLREAGFRVVRTYGIGFWIVRSALERPEILQSRAARLLQSATRVPPLAPFCPDAVIVAVPSPRR